LSLTQRCVPSPFNWGGEMDGNWTTCALPDWMTGSFETVIRKRICGSRSHVYKLVGELVSRKTTHSTVSL